MTDIKGLNELMALYQQYNIKGLDDYNAKIEEEIKELMQDLMKYLELTLKIIIMKIIMIMKVLKKRPRN